jgi:UDP-N-acetylmuramate: L-alanyl-gamma-D-glutamyl-meso-diaminopimelate ligase
MNFSVLRGGASFGEFVLAAPGRHNVLNALAAIAVAHGRGISAAQMAESLATFRSVKRRMDVKGEIHGVLVVDDFAHHPTAVTATIQAARGRWPGRKLWAILEPRSNSMRRKIFEETLPKALSLADRLVTTIACSRKRWRNAYGPVASMRGCWEAQARLRNL